MGQALGLAIGVRESLRVLCAIKRGSSTVTTITEKTEMPPGEVLAWLALLKADGLISASEKPIVGQQGEYEAVFTTTQAALTLLVDAKALLAKVRV